MKRVLSLLLLSLAVAAAFHACRKDFSEEIYTGPDGRTRADLGLKIEASVSGFVTDENGQPTPGVTVSAGGVQVTTNKFGYFELAKASVPKLAGMVKADKPGYFSGIRTFLPEQSGETFVRIQLIPKKEAGTLSATVGGTATTTDGAKITLPANGVVVAGSNAAYAGQVHVAAHWLNPTGNALAQTMPGDLRGIDSAGFMKALITYGMLAVELTGDAGQKLQVAAGSLATISVPIPGSLAGSAPADIILWSFDEDNGLWKQESVAQKVGGEYMGKVSHFSFWNYDVPADLVEMKAQLVDEKRQPLKNVLVSVSIKGQEYSGRGAYTDSSGYVKGFVPNNANLLLDVFSECRTSVYSKEFTTTTANVDLGTISANLVTYSATIMGTVADCGNLPVEDGYVFTSGTGFVNRIRIVDGSFSHTGILCSTAGTDVTMVAVDSLSQQQGSSKLFSIKPGENNLGQLSACGVSIATTITFAVDGVAKTITDNTISGNTGLLGFLSRDSAGQNNKSTNVIDVRTGGVQGEINFEFDGGNTIDNNHLLKNLFLPGTLPYNGQAFAGPTPIKVNVTEYGQVGQFITGSFNGQVFDSAKVNLHTVNVSFRVRRAN